MMTARTSRIARLIRQELGAALLEFSFMLMLLLILTFGIIDFGRALYTANALSHAAREGARYAAVIDDPAGSTSAIQDIVVAHMNPFAGALSPSQVTVTYNYGGSPPALQSTTVSVAYPFHWLTPIRSLLNWGSGSYTTLHTRAQYRWEQTGG